MKQTISALVFVVILNYALGAKIIFDDREEGEFARIIWRERLTSQYTKEATQHRVEFYWNRISHEARFNMVEMHVSGVSCESFRPYL